MATEATSKQTNAGDIALTVLEKGEDSNRSETKNNNGDRNSTTLTTETKTKTDSVKLKVKPVKNKGKKSLSSKTQNSKRESASMKRRQSLRSTHSLVKQNQEDQEGQDPDDAPDDEHWGRYTVSTGSYGGRAVGGKKPKDVEKYAQIEAMDFTARDTVERTMHARFMIQRDPNGRCCWGWSGVTQRRFQLWVMYILIGVMVSMFIGAVLYVCGLIENMRVTAVKDILKTGDVGGAWLSWTGSSLILCLVAVCCVLIEPAAASSGIPGLIAFLNGVQAKGGISPVTGKGTSFTSWETMLAKTVGMLASVPSGIAIGPEGPIIHISALIAQWTSKTVISLEHYFFPHFEFAGERNDEIRDFLATGAACGICTAFRAPLAGVLFVVEEAGSFFTTVHLEYTFMACLVSYWVTWAATASFTGESTVKFKQTTGDFCSYHDFMDYMFFVLLGIIGGMLGALFNHIVEEMNEFRREHVNNYAWRRVFEVIVVVLLTGTAAVCLPAAFMCKQELRAVMMEDSAGCLNAEDQFQLSHGTVSHPFLEALLNQAANCSADVITSGTSSSGAAAASGSRMLLAAASSSDGTGSGTSSAGSGAASMTATIPGILEELKKYRSGNSYLTLGGVEDVVWMDNGNPYIHLHYVHGYSCDASNHEYNEMAMLWLNGGVKAVKVLLQRGFPHMLSWQVLIVFCIVYFFLAAITAGISVPAGLVVPMMLIGASYGRLIGLGALVAKKSTCAEYSNLDSELAWTDTYYWSTYVRWLIRTSCRMPDPGTYAIVGAASFLGGSGRITVMLATVLLELTDDASMIAPVGICCILSMLVGNMFNHGLYHGLIPLFNVPYLNIDPPPEAQLAQVKDVMSINPIIVPKLMHMSHVEDLLDKCNEADMDKQRGTRHHGFPHYYLEKYEDNYDPHTKFEEGEEVWWSSKNSAGNEQEEEATIMTIHEHGSARKNSKPGEYTHLTFTIKVEGIDHTVKHNALRKLKGCTHNAFPVVTVIKTDSIGNRTGILEGMISRKELKVALGLAKNGEHTLHFIHLMKYCDRSPLTVYPNTRLSRAYSMFQKLGMRHLPVVSETGLVQGMITRKNLMAYLLTEEKEQELIKIRNVQIGAKRFLARRRRESDAWFEQHSTSNTEEMTLIDFRKSMLAFRLGLTDFLPTPLEESQQEELMTFIDASSAGSVISKSKFKLFLAKVRQWRLKTMSDITWARVSDAWFEQHSTSNATTQEMTQSEFRKSIVAFRLGPKDLLPDPLPIERQEELMTFVNASSAGTIINKSMYRILLAKAREWRLNIMGDTNWLSLSYVDKLQTIAHVREWRHHDF